MAPDGDLVLPIDAFRESVTTIQGRTLSWLDWGADHHSDPAVVCLHGAMGSGHIWDQFAAKLAVGYLLEEIRNDITRETPACFEPTIDYVVVKVPRFAFEKFAAADPTLNTQMKSVGEAMAIGRTFKESLQKALRSLEVGRSGLGGDGKPWRIGPDVYGDRDILPRELITQKLSVPNAERVFFLVGVGPLRSAKAAEFMRAKIPVYQLERQAEGHPAAASQGVYLDRASRKPVKGPGSELDLRGMRVDEALSRVDEALNDAALDGVSLIRMIHGKGTGALRRAIREYLGGHPLVISAEDGEGPGGDGVTVAELE